MLPPHALSPFLFLVSSLSSSLWSYPFPDTKPQELHQHGPYSRNTAEALFTDLMPTSVKLNFLLKRWFNSISGSFSDVIIRSTWEKVFQNIPKPHPGSRLTEPAFLSEAHPGEFQKVCPGTVKATLMKMSSEYLLVLKFSFSVIYPSHRLPVTEPKSWFQVIHWPSLLHPTVLFSRT